MIWDAPEHANNDHDGERSNAMTSTETLRARIDRAAEQAEAQKEALLNRDGSRFYSDEEHQRRMEAIAEEIGRAAAEVDEEAAKIIEDRERQLDRHLHNDPTAALSGEQLESANLRRFSSAGMPSSTSAIDRVLFMKKPRSL